MTTPSQRYLQKFGLSDPAPNAAEQTDQQAGPNRRDFIKNVGMTGLALGAFINAPITQTIEHSTSKVNRASAPSDLKITDMRYAVVMNGGGRCPVIRIDTNQGIYGLGEVRDGANWRYALFLKSRIMGMNPCSVEMIFKKIKQFGFHGRQAGGVCAVEMALWDLAGKAYNVPAYQLLGGKYRDKIRLYADTPRLNDPVAFAAKMKDRVESKGYTFLKMDFGIESLHKIPGTLSNSNFWDVSKQWENTQMTYGGTEHPFTQVQITDKGLEILADYVGKVREAVGYEIPLSSDHYGHFDKNNAIRLGRAVEKYRLAWLEDLIPWKYTEDWKEISQAIETPTLTGEDIYLKEEFIKLVDHRAVDLIHPDLASSGGLLETKKIGDYAEERGVAMAMHFAGTPISFMANVHCAAATQNFVALEHHSVDLAYWENLVKKTDVPLIEKGFANVPNRPGLGVDLNDEEVKKHLDPEDQSYFKPTPEWDQFRSWDRLWS
ncbi:MAG TPA: mandelate racemase/muconate lactonizing enzyme family protein [Haliscomenobacter sp.]|uniref:mandelate racemase/muconate lactonizing enzyme family protein n=1 Tax=Haliscomenobacter sp. TaxID=2717303 RepID=UPI002C698F53|nr:mandelate racemase/muconate lactonizing enzyme family protein [Haliscomenobacter sp.]HOY20863.1 mandelate racemase/muconate lactonizing enzyme family protein [Haliscomenobacter sp.]